MRAKGATDTPALLAEQSPSPESPTSGPFLLTVQGLLDGTADWKGFWKGQEWRWAGAEVGPGQLGSAPGLLPAPIPPIPGGVLFNTPGGFAINTNQGTILPLPAADYSKGAAAPLPLPCPSTSFTQDTQL